jgi:hypothetical protein
MVVAHSGFISFPVRNEWVIDCATTSFRAAHTRSAYLCNCILESCTATIFILNEEHSLIKEKLSLCRGILEIVAAKPLSVKLELRSLAIFRYP